MICGEASVVIDRPARDVLEFVLDLERYRQADTKIGRVRSMERRGDEGRVRFGGRLRGVPAVAAPFDWRLDPWSRLDFTSAPGFVERALVHFEGSFTCEKVGESTRVVHRECFAFRRPWRWALEPYLRAWLAADTSEEMARMKRMLEEEMDDAA